MDALYEHHKRAALLHAYGIEGEWEAARERVTGFIEGALGVSCRGNPDAQSRFYDVFGIDESRSLEAAAHRLALAERKFFLIGCRSMTHEAQNALLKLFEEAPRQTHFFLVVPSIAQLLPTLRSRLFLIQAPRREADEAAAEALLGEAPAARLRRLGDIIENKDWSRAQALVSGLEQALAKRLGEKPDRRIVAALGELRHTRRYLADRGASLKLLLETLALLLPAPSRA